VNTSTAHILDWCDTRYAKTLLFLAVHTEGILSVQKRHQHKSLHCASVVSLIGYWIGILGAFPFASWLLLAEMYFIAIPLTGMCIRSTALRHESNTVARELNKFFGNEKVYRRISLLALIIVMTSATVLFCAFDTTFGLSLGTISLFLFVTHDVYLSLIPRPLV
jgi:uncharacterized phage infection (PIP) family protein YhgE